MQHFLIDFLRLTVWLVILVAVFVPLEKLFALRPAKIWRAQSGIDLCWYFINSLLPTAIISLPIAILVWTLQDADPLGFYSAVAS